MHNFSMHFTFFFPFYLGQYAIDMAANATMKQILGVQPVRHLQKTASRFEGLLLRVISRLQMFLIRRKNCLFFTSPLKYLYSLNL